MFQSSLVLSGQCNDGMTCILIEAARFQSSLVLSGQCNYCDGTKPGTKLSFNPHWSSQASATLCLVDPLRHCDAVSTRAILSTPSSLHSIVPSTTSFPRPLIRYANLVLSISARLVRANKDIDVGSGKLPSKSTRTS